MTDYLAQARARRLAAQADPPAPVANAAVLTGASDGGAPVAADPVKVTVRHPAHAEVLEAADRLDRLMLETGAPIHHTVATREAAAQVDAVGELLGRGLGLREDFTEAVTRWEAAWRAEVAAWQRGRR